MSAWIKQRGYGSKKQLALHTGTQTAYVSQVINGQAHFNSEQCLRLKSLLELTQEELNFFILLNQYDRAGTMELKEFYKNQIDSIITSKNLIKIRIGNSISMDAEDQSKYFSAWYTAAIHTALLIPKLRSIKNLSAYFNLSVDTVTETLELLVEKNLVVKSNQEYKSTHNRMHLTNENYLTNHHFNWRLQAMNNIAKKNPKSLHFSAVFSLAKSDAEEFRSKLHLLIQEFEKKLQTSTDEALFVLGIDWFELI